MGPCLAVEGATTATVFEASYVEKVLAPSLRSGQIVVVVDNLGAQKGERARKLIEGRGSASYSSCHRTHRTSIPSRKLSRRSRAFCEKPLSPNPRSPDRSARGSDLLGGQRKGRSGLPRAWRIPSVRPASMKHAVGRRALYHTEASSRNGRVAAVTCSGSSSLATTRV